MNIVNTKTYLLKITFHNNTFKCINMLNESYSLHHFFRKILDFSGFVDFFRAIDFCSVDSSYVFPRLQTKGLVVQTNKVNKFLGLAKPSYHNRKKL